MMNVTDQIHADLERQQQSRRTRTMIAGAVVSALVLAFVVITKPAEHLEALDIFTAAIIGVFAIFSLSATKSLRFGPWLAAGVALIGVATPWLATRALGDSIVGWGCAISVVALGGTCLLAMRLILGRHSRRFGGAPTLYGLCASLAALLGVGLHCPLATSAHLATHVLGAMVLVFGLAHLLFGQLRSADL